MFPNCDSPVPQVLCEKSSVKVARVEREFVFVFVFVSSVFVFLFALRLATRVLELFELLLLVLVTLKATKTRIPPPISINTSTAPIPRSHGQMLRFCAAGGGMGDQAGGGAADIGGGACCTCPGLKAIVGWALVSRACGYCTVALGSEGGGALVPSNGEPSSRQKLRPSSAYVRLHWGQRFMFGPHFLKGTEPLAITRTGGRSVYAFASEKSR